MRAHTFLNVIKEEDEFHIFSLESVGLLNKHLNTITDRHLYNHTFVHKQTHKERHICKPNHEEHVKITNI